MNSLKTGFTLALIIGSTTGCQFFGFGGSEDATQIENALFNEFQFALIAMVTGCPPEPCGDGYYAIELQEKTVDGKLVSDAANIANAKNKVKNAQADWCTQWIDPAVSIIKPTDKPLTFSRTSKTKIVLASFGQLTIKGGDFRVSVSHNTKGLRAETGHPKHNTVVDDEDKLCPQKYATMECLLDPEINVKSDSKVEVSWTGIPGLGGVGGTKKGEGGVKSVQRLDYKPGQTRWCRFETHDTALSCKKKPETEGPQTPEGEDKPEEEEPEQEPGSGGESDSDGNEDAEPPKGEPIGDPVGDDGSDGLDVDPSPDPTSPIPNN